MLRPAALSAALLLGVTLLPAAPAAAESEPDPLQARLEAIVFRGAVGAVGEVQGGDRPWSGSAGESRLAPSRTVDDDARFRAASVTKQLVAVLALQLVDRDVWTLRTTLGDVLPDVWPEHADVTLRQLLSHTSGAPDYLPALIADARTTEDFVRAIGARRTDRELVGVARGLDWLFEPGTSWAYSNTNYVLVGMMLKEQTGASLPSLMRTRVLKPARMGASSFGTRRGLDAPRLREYAIVDSELVDLARFHPSMFSSAGALVTNARDLNRFQLALSQRRLTSAKSLKAMRSVVWKDAASGLRYGLGSYRLPDPCTPGRWLHGHDGGSWGTVTMSFSSPSGKRRATAAFTGRNLDGGLATTKALSRWVTRAFREDCAKPTAKPTAPTRLPALDLRIAPPDAG